MDEHEEMERTDKPIAAEPTEPVEQTEPIEMTEQQTEPAEALAAQESEAPAAEPTEEKQEVPAAELTEEPQAEPTAKPAASGKGNVVAIVAGLLVFFGLLFAMWQMYGVPGEKGILYAKENNLYYYDLQNEPYLLQEGISDGGFYSIAGSAWGAKQAERGNFVYYPAQIQENGAFTLYRRDISALKGEALLIASNVVDYQISADGRTAAYLTMPGDAEPLQFCVFDGKESRVIEENLQWQQNLYALRADGKYLVYYDAYSMFRVQQLDKDVPSVVLTDAAAMYSLAEESGILYYVSQNGEVYDIYSYDFQKDPVRIAENVTYMEVMPNGRDLLYCVSPQEQVLYRDIVTDDMAEEDAAIAEGDAAYEAKLERDAIREAMEKGEGIAPILQKAYVFTGGQSILVAENVISAMGVAGDTPFVAGYGIEEFAPLPLSEISGGLDMLEMYYYLSLGNSSLHTFLADTNGTCETLTGYQIPPESIQIAPNGKNAAYLATDANMGGNILMEMEIGKAADAAAMATDIERFAFLDDALCYAYVKNGTNYLQVGEDFVDNVTVVAFDTEAGKVYFIRNANTETGVGKMQSWNGKDAVEQIAENIYAYQNLGGGKLALLGGEGIGAVDAAGDLSYFDGKSLHSLDTKTTAIFMD